MVSLEGMYDIHSHPAPSVKPRKFTALQALKLASAEKMAGIFLLDHTYNTTVIADTINELGLSAKAYGAIFLNEAVGGLSPSVVEIALRLGTKQIQMPTYSSKAHFEAYGDDQEIFPYKKRAKPSFILDEAGKLIGDVEEILLLMKDSNSFLGTGHLSPKEIEVLIKRAKELGVKVLVNSVSTDMPGIPLDVQKTLARDNVFMEHDYMAITDVPHETVPVETVVEQIRGVGVEWCMLGTDSGAMKLPDNVTSMKNFIERLTSAGITEKEIDIMTRQNPKLILGIY
jgi:hypothetical protein